MKPTQEQVIAWAREAGLEQTISIAPDNSSRIVSCPPIEPLERLAALAYEAGRKDENEACEQICKQHSNYYAPTVECLIRARREQ